MATSAGAIFTAPAGWSVTRLGVAFDRAMRKELVAPLGMKTVPFDFAQALRGNHAPPHG